LTVGRCHLLPLPGGQDTDGLALYGLEDPAVKDLISARTVEGFLRIGSRRRSTRRCRKSDGKGHGAEFNWRTAPKWGTSPSRVVIAGVRAVLRAARLIRGHVGICWYPERLGEVRTGREALDQNVGAPPSTPIPAFAGDITADRLRSETSAPPNMFGVETHRSWSVPLFPRRPSVRRHARRHRPPPSAPRSRRSRGPPENAKTARPNGFLHPIWITASREPTPSITRKTSWRTGVTKTTKTGRPDPAGGLPGLGAVGRAV